MTRQWHNWARNETATPVRVQRPRSVTEVVGALAAARRDGLRVKAVGAGHSFTGIAVAPGVQLDLSGLSGVLEVQGNRVKIGAGTHLHQLPGLLAPLGLAMENLGDIDAQTIAGATSTGTHGTGAGFRGLAAQIAALTLVTAEGSAIEVTADSELFPAARLGLGALGVIVDVTLDCVASFKLHAVEKPEPLDAVIESYIDRCIAADHFEFYWFPHTRTALTKTNMRLPAGAPSRPLGRMRRWFDESLMANTVFAGVCSAGAMMPAAIPSINRTASKFTGDREFTDDSARVFTTQRRVRFHEMEYALPREAVTSALRDIERLIVRNGWRISFPLEVRTAAPDDLWLSTAHGRQTGYIAVHRYYKENYNEYFRGVEDIFRAYEGRPHWGKIHHLNAAGLRALYPRFDDFVALRDKLDPQGLFGNDYLDRVLG